MDNEFRKDREGIDWFTCPECEESISFDTPHEHWGPAGDEPICESCYEDLEDY